MLVVKISRTNEWHLGYQPVFTLIMLMMSAKMLSYLNVIVFLSAYSVFICPLIHVTHYHTLINLSNV